MKQITTLSYACDICGEQFSAEVDALECEARPISQSKGVKVGDIVKITKGEGQGRGEVTKVFIIKKSWGEWSWKIYWHTEAITAKCLDSYGERLLTFDDYEITQLP